MNKAKGMHHVLKQFYDHPVQKWKLENRPQNRYKKDQDAQDFEKMRVEYGI
jgi:hypothetical protein